MAFLKRKRENKIGGCSLLEVVFTLALVSLLMSVGLVLLDRFQERFILSNTSQVVTDALKQAQLLAFVHWQSHQVQIKDGKIQIYQKRNTSLPPIEWDQVVEPVQAHASQWPWFSPFGFAVGGTIYLETPSYETQIKINPIGSVRSLDIQKKVGILPD